MIEVLPGATPSAHSILAGPVLIDTGHGAPGRVAAINRFVNGRHIELIALTHAHGDHVGGASALRKQLDAPVALHGADHATIARDAATLAQPVAPFPIDVTLADGAELPGGLRAILTPSQTPGHMVFWQEAERTVVTGDLLQADDVAWMPFVDGALDQAIEAHRRIAELRPARAVPGHGPPVDNVPERVAETIATYERWRARPDRRAGHHARRIAAAWIALCQVRPRLADAVSGIAEMPMLADISAVLGITPVALAARTLEQLIGSGALRLSDDGRLLTVFPTEPVP